MTRTEILTIIQGGHLTDGDLADALLAELANVQDQLAECQRDIADLNEVRQNDIDEFNRVNTELAALKAEPRSERTKQLEDSIAAFFDSEIPKGNALAQEMCMIGRKYRSRQDRIYKLEAGEFQEKFKASVSARSE